MGVHIDDHITNRLKINTRVLLMKIVWGSFRLNMIGRKRKLKYDIAKYHFARLQGAKMLLSRKGFNNEVISSVDVEKDSLFNSSYV